MISSFLNTLVVTIIVLLLLAGVTINALSGDNGILTNAAKSKINFEFKYILTKKVDILKNNKNGCIKNVRY